MPVIDPVSSDSDFPKKTTVAVIGGGVIGVATALELAERGVPVVLYVRHAAEISSSRLAR